MLSDLYSEMCFSDAFKYSLSLDNNDLLFDFLSFALLCFSFGFEDESTCLLLMKMARCSVDLQVMNECLSLNTLRMLLKHVEGVYTTFEIFGVGKSSHSVDVTRLYLLISYHSAIDLL